MPLDPDDLLIFKVRRKGAPEQPAQQPTPAPNGSKPEQQKPQPEIQLPKAEPKSPQVLLKLFPQERPKPQQQKPQPSIAGSAAGAAQTQKAVAAPAQKEMPRVEVPVPKTAPQVVVPASYGDVEEAIRAALGTGAKSMISQTTKRESKAGADSRSAVYGLFCVWHPWRPAYAACGYCHRAFCFEDITDFEGNYYCLEDIDKVASKPVVAVSGQYNMLSMVSALLLFCSFFAFLYYNGSPLGIILSTVFGQAAKNGIIGALLSLSASDMATIAGTILTALGVVGGALILMRSRFSFMFGLIASFAIIVFFSYVYATSYDTYELIYPAVTLMALVVLIVSKNFIAGREEAPAHSAEQLGWSNTGRF
jgi:hypothetical protein